MPGGRYRRRVNMLTDDGHGVISNKGWPAGNHLIEHSPQGVEVGPGGDLTAHGLLRGHVVKGAHHHPGVGKAGEVNGQGQTEVADLGRAVGTEPYIARLDVTVDNPLAVGILQTPADGLGDSRLPARWAGGAPGLSQ